MSKIVLMFFVFLFFVYVFVVCFWLLFFFSVYKRKRGMAAPPTPKRGGGDAAPPKEEGITAMGGGGGGRHHRPKGGAGGRSSPLLFGGAPFLGWGCFFPCLTSGGADFSSSSLLGGAVLPLFPKKHLKRTRLVILKFSSVQLSGGPSSCLSVVRLSLPTLAGGAAWPPPSFGRAAFLPLLWVGLVHRKFKNTGPSVRGEDGGGEVESHTTRRRRRPGSTTQQKIG